MSAIKKPGNRLDAIEEHLGTIEQRLDTIEERLDTIEQRHTDEDKTEADYVASIEGPLTKKKPEDD